MGWLQYISQNVFPVFPALDIRTAGMFPKPQHCRYEPFWPCHFKIWSFAMNFLCEKKNVSLTHSTLRSSWWSDAGQRGGREEGPRRCDPSAAVGQHRVTWMKESRLHLDFGPILIIVLDMGIFQIPVGNPTFFMTAPVSWEAAGAHRARPGEAVLPSTRYPLTLGGINRLQQTHPAGNFSLQKHHPHC